LARVAGGVDMLPFVLVHGQIDARPLFCIRMG
jgi:hypothetical protein